MRSVRAALTIASRDVRSAFEGPLAYVLLAVFLAVSGLVFCFFLLSFSDLSEILRTESVRQGDPTLTQRLSVESAVVSPSLRALLALLIGLVPVLTMRGIAEERRQKTLELLLTAPVSSASIVAGKYLGALFISCAALALTVAHPLVLMAVARPDPGPLLTGYLGLFLVASAFTAMGILASTLTESSVAAGFLAFALIAGTVLLGIVGGQMSSNAGLVLMWLSPAVHFDSLAEGIVDVADLAYYPIFAIAALFVAHRILDSQRWR